MWPQVARGDVRLPEGEIKWPAVAGLKETQGSAHVCAIGGRLNPVVISTMSEHFNWVSLGPRDSTSQNFPEGNSWKRTPRFFAG